MLNQFDSSQTWPHALQFRITSLLVWTAWAAIIFCGMHVPTSLMADSIIHGSLLFALATIVVAVHRAGATRASSVGFAVLFFGVFWFGPLNPNYSIFSTEDAALEWLFHVIHPDDEVPLRMGGSWIAPPPYLSHDFARICQCAVATLLGLFGSLLAQYLYATQPRKKAANEAEFNA